MNTDHDILAAKYLSGELADGEAKAFEEKMASDPELRTELDTLAMYWNKMEPQEKQNFNTDAAWNKLEERMENESPKKLRKLNKWQLMSIAASVILIFGFTALLLADFLPGNNQLRYFAEQRMEIQLPDNSKVVLKKGSLLTLAEHFNKKNRAVNLKGEAWFEITPNKEKPFIIEAARSQIAVLGTTFSVESKPGEPDFVAVKTGKVSVIHKYSDQSIILTANQYAQIDDEKLEQVNEMEINYLGWALQKFYFSNESLATVSNELESAFNKRIVFSDPAIGNLGISATFKGQTFKEIVEIIAETHNLTYQLKGNRAILKRK